MLVRQADVKDTGSFMRSSPGIDDKRSGLQRSLVRGAYLFGFGALLLCSSFSALAQSATYATAGELRDDCAAIPAMLRGEVRALSAAGECIAFIDGMRAFAHVLQLRRDIVVLCVPDGVTTVDIAKTYVGVIDRMPERRAAPAAETLYQMLGELFPCGRSSVRGK
jgi:hypothetical protein